MTVANGCPACGQNPRQSRFTAQIASASSAETATTITSNAGSTHQAARDFRRDGSPVPLVMPISPLPAFRRGLAVARRSTEVGWKSGTNRCRLPSPGAVGQAVGESRVQASVVVGEGVVEYPSADLKQQICAPGAPAHLLLQVRTVSSTSNSPTTSTAGTPAFSQAPRPRPSRRVTPPPCSALRRGTVPPAGVLDTAQGRCGAAGFAVAAALAGLRQWGRAASSHDPPKDTS